LYPSETSGMVRPSTLSSKELLDMP